ncbi:MAG: hypothetical protein M1825_006053 [Sarcosagium campestre]|nr:MAG: hypothetical protein M1825_006053 [Sarcosagium campestre]
MGRGMVDDQSSILREDPGVQLPQRSASSSPIFVSRTVDSSSGLARREVKWVDGLRGVAALLVVTSHVCRSIAPYLIYPAFSEQGDMTALQIPLIRLPAQGPPWVALFFVLSGYVNAIKPVKMSRSGSADTALSSLSRNVFRRSCRLMLPPTLATLISWVLCELHGYDVARKSASGWLQSSSPGPAGTVFGALWSLSVSIVKTWTSGANKYDPIQWTLPYLLKGSMLVALTLLALVHINARYRIPIVVGLYFYSWLSKDAVVGMNIFAGLLVAELGYTTTFTTSKRTILSSLAPATLIIIGLLLCSYPEKHADWMWWSSILETAGKSIFPKNAEVWRFWPSIGVHLATLGILMSSKAKRLLSHHSLLWLGSISFPVYLLHGPLMRSLFSWLLFGFTLPQGTGAQSDPSVLPESLPIPSLWRVILVCPVFYGALFLVSHLWTLHVEPCFATLTSWIEDRLFREDQDLLPTRKADL